MLLQGAAVEGLYLIRSTPLLSRTLVLVCENAVLANTVTSNSQWFHAEYYCQLLHLEVLRHLSFG